VRRLTAPIATAAFPELADRTPEAAARVAARVLRANFVYTVAIAVGLALGAPLMPRVFGAAYAPAVPVLWVLLLAVTALAGHRILAQYFSAVDRQLVNVLVLLASLAVNVGLNLWWIPEHGALGAAAASLVSYAVETALSLSLFARSSRLGLRAILVPEPGELSGLARRVAGRLRRR
jgi:O-antigen/teichoic acid export membrane protein